MRTRVTSSMLLALAISACTGQSFAQEEDYSKHPGYVDFVALADMGKAESTVEVFLKGPLLKFAAAATAGSDTSLSRVLSKLGLIRVNTFAIDDQQSETISRKIKKTAARLRKQDWDLLVRVKEPDELVQVYTKAVKGKMAGLVVMSVEYGDEVSFVNIVGDIDMEALGKLGGKFNIPKLDSVSIKKK